MRNKVLIRFILLSAVAAFFQVNAQPIQLDTKHIQVNGQASVISVPDMFHFSVYLEQQGELVSKLNALVNEKSKQIVILLLKEGVAEADVQSMRVQLSPWFEHRQNPRVQKGFLLSREIKITLRNADKYDQLIDGLLRLGASRIEGFNYAIEDPKENYLKALELALKDATLRGTTMAKAMGLRIGNVLSIREGSDYSPLPSARGAMLMSESGGYLPGQISTNAQVSVVFALDN